MRTTFLLILSVVCSLQSYAQLFIDDGPGGGLYITDASGGTLASPEILPNNTALFVDSNIVVEGTYANDSAEVQLTGNLYNSGTFTTTGDEVFTGANTQIVSGSFTGSNDFYNLIVTKDAGTSIQLGATIETDTQGVVNLNQGLIQTTTSYFIYVKNSSTTAIVNAGTNGSLDQLIEGELRRNTVQGSTYDFPVAGTHVDAGGGDGVQYVSIRSNSGDGVVSAIFHDSTGIAAADSLIICPGGVGDYQDMEYRIRNGSWELSNPGGGISNYNITLNPTDYTNIGYTDYTILQNGIPTGRDSCDGAASFPPITHDSLTSFSLFEVGAATSVTLLPVELISFEAVPTKDYKVALRWETASESNNKFFAVQRSKNLTDWEEINTITGAGNSTQLISYNDMDLAPYPGTSYYRVKQTNYDGSSRYSEAKSVNLDAANPASVVLYPTATDHSVTMIGSELELSSVHVSNAIGQDVTGSIETKVETETRLILDISNLNAGWYYVRTKNSTNRVYKL